MRIISSPKKDVWAFKNGTVFFFCSVNGILLVKLIFLIIISVCMIYFLSRSLYKHFLFELTQENLLMYLMTAFSYLRPRCVSSGVCAYVKSSRAQELEVLLSQFPESFPMPMKTTQSELVLTRVDSPN